MFVCSKNCTFAKGKPFLAKEGNVYYFCISISTIVHLDLIKSIKNYFDIEGNKYVFTSEKSINTKVLILLEIR